MLRTTALLCIVAGLTAPSHAAIMADSVADYSGTQGQNGWYYGYYEVSSTSIAPTFQQMTEFDGVRWWADSSRYWTMVGPLGAHPNGTLTSGSMVSDEHWAVRRWVSSTTDLVDVNAVYAKLNVNPASNGVTGRIWVNGVEMWNDFIGPTDATGALASLQLNVVPGTTIDFILDPTAGNDWADNTRMSAVITSVVPAPAAGALLGIAGIAAIRRRRHV